MVIAGIKLPIPSRTRPISVLTPMVLRLKTWESRSPPDLKRDISLVNDDKIPRSQNQPSGTDAGWSSPVARQAHNLKAAGSNPAPATKFTHKINRLRASLVGGFLRSAPVSALCQQNHGGIWPRMASHEVSTQLGQLINLCLASVVVRLAPYAREQYAGSRTLRQHLRASRQMTTPNPLHRPCHTRERYLDLTLNAAFGSIADTGQQRTLHRTE